MDIDVQFVESMCLEPFLDQMSEILSRFHRFSLKKLTCFANKRR